MRTVYTNGTGPIPDLSTNRADGAVTFSIIRSGFNITNPIPIDVTVETRMFSHPLSPEVSVPTSCAYLIFGNEYIGETFEACIEAVDAEGNRSQCVKYTIQVSADFEEGGGGS